MQSISDIIQAIARQRGRAENGPLLLVRPLEAGPGERISHLPVGGELGQAWQAMTGEPFLPHQAHALTSLRRGEPVALRADSADVAMTLNLLVYAMLTAEAHTTAVVLVPDENAGRMLRAWLEQIARQLPESLRLSVTLVEGQQRPNPYARVVICTADALHSRLLRHHDRAWQLCWARLRMLAIPDIHSYHGIAGAHLSELLMRARRIAALHSGGTPLAILATLSQLHEPELALAGILGASWRVVAADDGPRSETLFAAWRGGAARLRDAAELAMAFQRNGYQVHVACELLERAVITPIIGDVPGISVGPGTPAAQVLVVVGYPGSQSMLRRMLRSGYVGVVLVTGELPHELALIRQLDGLFNEVATTWPPSQANAYVTAQHVLCAASELPLTSDEVLALGAQAIVERQVQEGLLVDLPDPEVAWKPGLAVEDPYQEFNLLASSGGAILARTEQGRPVTIIDPTGFERWTFPGAALPPGAGGMRVMVREEESGSIVLRLESNCRRTYPLRRCTVDVREEREIRTLAGGAPLGSGRVVVEEEIYGYRELVPGGQPVEMKLEPALRTRWIATACWFTLSTDTQVMGQMIGWSLAAALALRTLASFTDLVPCYDHAQRRLYLVDAQPGGNGLASWLYQHAEELLPVAYDVAYACRNDALLEPLSRNDMDWLLALLGRTAMEARNTQATIERPRSNQAVPVARAPERAAIPPVAPQQRVLITAPPEPPKPETPPAKRDEPRPSSRPPERQNPPPAEPSAPPQPERQNPPREEPRPSRPPQPEQRPPARSREERQSERHNRNNPPNQRPSVAPNQRRDQHQGRGPARPAEPRNEPPARSNQPPAPQARNEPPARSNPASPPPAPQPPPEEEQTPDANALIERLRRQREQREKQTAPAQAPARRSSQETEPVEPRFKRGERVFCLPYGDGVVSESRIEDGRELLTVTFSSHGDLEIDPAISLVRKIEDSTSYDDDLL